IIKPEEITHIVGDGNYSTFHLKDGRSLVASKYLAYYEDLLDKNLFFRIHQSHLVNLNDVRQIDTQEGLFAIMTNGNKLPLARRRKEAFLKALA
ncbi:MAG: LytTR family DNA-binding domain-containing protein, partial [Bacteroidota bacterium]